MTPRVRCQFIESGQLGLHLGLRREVAAEQHVGGGQQNKGRQSACEAQHMVAFHYRHPVGAVMTCAQEMTLRG